MQSSFIALVLAAVPWIPTILAAPVPKYATLVTERQASKTQYDFIIAGGGLAGLTVADRLTEDPSVNVLVIESGPIEIPEATPQAVPGLYNPASVLWLNQISVPQSELDNKSFLAPSGKVVGGGSVANALLWYRSSKEEYDSWQQLGATNLTWDSLLPYFIKSENFSVPDPQFSEEANISYVANVHGTSGPIHVSNANFFYPSSGNWWQAAQDTGLSIPQDVNNGDQAGIYNIQWSVDPSNRTRSDAQISFFSTVAARRPNYHLLANSTVSQILFNGNQTTGVQYIPTAGGEATTVNASKEVLVAAGGVRTPQLLQLSGIGPEALLSDLSIAVVSVLPGVGTNMQDTPNFMVPYDISNNRFPSETDFVDNATYRAEQMELYNTQATGPFVISGNQSTNAVNLPLQNITSNYTQIVNAAMSQDPAASLPADTDPTVLAGYKIQRKIRLQQLLGASVPSTFLLWSTGTNVRIFLGGQLSRGTVMINSTNSLDNPVIDWRTLTDPVDYKVLVATVLRNRQIMQAPGMAPLGAHEVAPFGDNITDFDTIKAAIASVGEPTLAHMCCTAPQMSLANGGVVDSEYKVYGTSGLRVIDSAAIPILPTLPPQAPLYALAERVADMIKQEYSLSS